MEPEMDKLLTVFQAEAMTGRKAATWRKDILKQRVGFVKIGRQVRIPLKEVRAMIAKGYREPIPSPPARESAPPDAGRRDLESGKARRGKR